MYVAARTRGRVGMWVCRCVDGVGVRRVCGDRVLWVRVKGRLAGGAGRVGVVIGGPFIPVFLVPARADPCGSDGL